MSTSSTYASFVERERETWPGIEAEHCHGNEHEQRQKHHPRKLIWKCVQPDSQALELQTPFDACTKCKEGKEYNKASNAAAHFKRCHLRPAIDGRGSRAPAATTVAAVVPGVSVLKDLGYLAQFEVPDTERQNTEEPSGKNQYRRICIWLFPTPNRLIRLLKVVQASTRSSAVFQVVAYRVEAYHVRSLPQPEQISGPLWKVTILIQSPACITQKTNQVTRLRNNQRRLSPRKIAPL
jgi:hypothetical protein